MNSMLAGLYAITPASLTDIDTLTQQVNRALQGGARLIQYRDKSTDVTRRLAAAQQLRRITRDYQALLLINDDVELAREVAADGVHLGRNDTDLQHAREMLGPQAIIGISCYNRFELAQRAEREGADYVAFGSFFPSRTKPDAVRADLHLLQQAARQLKLPVAAIGGINPGNADELIAAGAQMLAVVEAVFGSDDIQSAARQLALCFQQTAIKTRPHLKNSHSNG